MKKSLSIILAIVLIVFELALIGAAPPTPIVALAAGFQEFYLPLPTGDATGLSTAIGTYSVFNAIEPPISAASGMHYVVGVTASANNTTVYYDHWENGYGTGTTGADEVVNLNKGQVHVFESSAIPVPRGTGTKYDGRDRVFVSGSLLQCVVSTWTEDQGTLFTDAWEVYPIQAWEKVYPIAVGENLANSPTTYRNFTYVYALIMSATDSNTVVINDPVGPTTTTVTLNRGQNYVYKVKGAGATVTATAKVQVQLMTGRRDTTGYEMRGYTITPQSYWGTAYYSPVSGWSNSNLNLYVYNPNASQITINYQDLSGTGSFTVNAKTTRSFRDGAGRYVPQNSGTYLSSTSTFWGIGAGDDGSGLWDWGYDLIPINFLGSDNYVSWAPGTRTKNDNGSPVYVTALNDNTTVFVDYGPNDNVIDATYTVNRLHSIKIFGTLNDNTGMHIISTAPIAVAWGEDPEVAGQLDPYLDMGYTTLPLPQEFIDIALTVHKTANPTLIIAGQQSQFSVTISVPNTAGAAVTSLSLVDNLPPGWQYVTGSGSPSDPTTITGSLAAGYTLTWSGLPTINIGGSQTFTFSGLSTASANTVNPNRNLATATGQSLGATLTADDQAFVQVTPVGASLSLIKNGALDSTVVPPNGQANPGDKINYTFTVTNTGNVTLTNVTVTDPLVTVSGSPIASLAPGASDNSTFTGTHVLTQADINSGQFINTATATGTPPSGPNVTDNSTKTVTIPQLPGIDLLKNGALDSTVVFPSGEANPGDKINYTFTVTNTGNVTLNNVTITDPKVTVSGGPLASLAPGVSNSGTFTGSYTLSQSDINSGQVDNTATTTGTPPSGPNVTDNDTETVTISQLPGIDLVKNGALDSTVIPPSGETNPGDKINYTFTVTNTGNVTLTNVTVTDPLVTVSGGPIASLAPGASNSGTFTGAYTLTQADINAGHFVNTATTTGTPPSGPNISDNDTNTVIISQLPGIDLLKNGALDSTLVPPNGQANPGDKINYTFTVTNTGNVILTNVTVTDPKVTVSGGPLASLAPGASNSGTFTGSYTLTQSDINSGQVDNTATATGTPPSGPNVTDNDTETVTISQLPGIDLVKNGVLDSTLVPPNGQANPGDKINYTFTVTNTGNVILANVTVTDPKVTVSGGPLASLAPGVSNSGTFTGSYTLTQSDINAGHFVNTATATGTPPSGPNLTDNDTSTVTISQLPGIDLLKNGALDSTLVPPNGQANPGDKINYTFTVTNTGNVALTNVTVTDPLVTVTGGPIASLAPGASNSGTFIGSYTLTQSDINSGQVDNTATTTGTPPSGPNVSDNDTSTVSISQLPGIDLVKNGILDSTLVPPNGQANPGDKINYTFTITNTGNVALTNVTVTDPLVTVTGGPIASLAPGASNSGTFIGSYTLTQSDINSGQVDNTATTTGTPPSGPNVSDNDTSTVTISQLPGIDLVKYGDLDSTVVPPNGEANPGDKINYTFTITNTGNVTLTNVTVTDPLIGVSGGPILSLLPGASDNTTFTASHILTQADINAGHFVNTATATGTPPSGPNVSDNDTSTVTISQLPGIDLVKYGDLDSTVVPPNGEANPGDKINYTFTITNTGNVTLTNVTVTDPLIGVSGGPILSLLPGASDNTTFTASHILTQADINAGHFVNTATATGTPPSGPNVTDNDTSTVTISQLPGIDLVKYGDLDSTVVPPNGEANPGDKINYTFTITNTGNVTLTNVTVTDPLIGVSGGPILSLLPGASDNTTFTASHTLTQADINAGHFVNTATSTGTPPSGPNVSDNDTSTVTISQLPGIDLVKYGDLDSTVVPPNGEANPGDKINYTFTITNTGNVTLTNVTVTDPLIGVSGGPILSLLPGASDNTTFTASHTLTQADINAGHFVNTATTTGTPPQRP